MNISKLTLLQKDLDAVVNKNHPIKKGEDRVANKFNALVVELAEFANEGRWFKYWSKNQTPKTKNNIYAPCDRCDGVGEDPFNSFEACSKCGADGELLVNKTNPLLEEYVDALHFFISIAIDKDWESALRISEETLVAVEEKGLEGGITETFNLIIYRLIRSHFDGRNNDVQFHIAWTLFMVMGLIGFGFTDEEIEAAYMSKNKENHSRQHNGY